MSTQPTYPGIVHGKDSAIHIDKKSQTTSVQTPTYLGTTDRQQQRSKIERSAQLGPIDQHRTTNNQTQSPIDGRILLTTRTSPTDTGEGIKETKITTPNNSPSKQLGYNYSYKNGMLTSASKQRADHYIGHEQLHHHPSSNEHIEDQNNPQYIGYDIPITTAQGSKKWGDKYYGIRKHHQSACWPTVRNYLHNKPRTKVWVRNKKESVLREQEEHTGTRAHFLTSNQDGITVAL